MQFQRRASVRRYRNDELELLLLSRPKMHVEDQQALILHAVRPRTKSLGSCHLGVLCLKQQAAALRVPGYFVVGLARRIRKPRLGLLRHAPTHIEGERELACRSAQILDRNRLRHCPLLRGKKHARLKLQAVDDLLAHPRNEETTGTRCCLQARPRWRGTGRRERSRRSEGTLGSMLCRELRNRHRAGRRWP